jgi:transcriptional regulator GlxA family with amidase domain
LRAKIALGLCGTNFVRAISKSWRPAVVTYFSKVTSGLIPKRVGLLGFDGVAALDLTGPLEAISKAQHALGQGAESACYKSIIIGLTGKTFVSESGLLFKADETAENAGPLDTIIVPGGKGLRDVETGRRAGAWLASRADAVRRIASVSTGIYALAQSGLVDGRLATTHWRFFRDVAQRFPKLRLSNSAAFLKQDKFYTSGGGTAGIEMTLALIEEDYGGQVALAVARELVMRLRPPGDGGRDFEPTHYQYDPTERVADLPAWIAAHLHETLTVEFLAARACLCPRHFGRVFKQLFHCTPADFVEELRLTEARRRLLGLRGSVESIAESVGFKSSDAFRRAFERRIGVTPSAFRRNSRLAASARPRPALRAAA